MKTGEILRTAAEGGRERNRRKENGTDTGSSGIRTEKEKTGYLRLAAADTLSSSGI